MNHLSPDLLNLYLDDELNPVTRGNAEAHLATCLDCRRELRALRDVFTQLAALPDRAPPVDLAGRVLAQLGPQSRRWRLAPAAVLAVQVAFATGLAAGLAPVLLDSLASGRSALIETLTLLPDPDLLGPMVRSAGPWVDAVTRVIRASFPSLTLVEWALALSTLGIVWFVGTWALVVDRESPVREAA
jgi:hypothetical protein